MRKFAGNRYRFAYRRDLAARRPRQAHIAFVACPIVQDTPSVPCWLDEYDGKTYYMGIQIRRLRAVQPAFAGA